MVSEKEKERMKKYHEEHKEEINARLRKYRLDNREIINRYRRERYKSDPSYCESKKKSSRKYRLNNKEKIKGYMTEYWKNNRQRLLEQNRLRSRKWYTSLDKKEYRAKKRVWEREAKRKNIQFAIRKRLRLRVWQVLNGIRKEMYDSEFHLDYKPIVDKLISELPKDFKNNYLNYQIDHIVPLHLFDLTKQEELLKAFAPSNHQWLTVEEHRIKSNNELRDLICPQGKEIAQYNEY